MSINKNILMEIEGLDISREAKDAIIDILKVEDNGTNRYSSDYETIIAAYVKATKGNKS